MIHRLIVCGLFGTLMIVGVSFLSGYVFPLALHHLLKLVALDHWVNCGMDYATPQIIARAPDDAPRVNLWNAIIIDAKLQLSAIPFFAVLAAVPAVGVALWVAIGSRPVPLWFAAVLGAAPGFSLVVAVVIMNWSIMGSTPSNPIEENLGEMRGAVPQSLVAVMWSWFVSRSLLVAAGSMASTWIANRLLPS